MDKICRFCLKVSSRNMCSLEECDILYNIQKFLTIDISAEESFPNNLCKECFKKITQVIEFCLTVKENEEKLQQLSKNGLLQDYYSEIINLGIKEEKNEDKLETYYVKVEEDIERNSESDDNDNDIGIIKKEVSSEDCNDAHYSSEDDITLSSIKQGEVLDTTPIDKAKKITKFTPLRSLNKNPKRKKKERPETEYIKPFICLTCLKYCDSQADLIRHYDEDHFRYKVTRKNYTKLKTGGKTTYKCDSCEKICNLKKNIVKHVMSHTDERPLVCKLCARTYKTVHEIIRHARAHNGFRLQCPYNCGYTTAYQGALKDHKSRHLNEYKYTCEKCGKGFNIKTWYDQHQNLHTGLKPFICNLCGLAFPMARYLHTHKSAKHPQSLAMKRYSCVHCEQKCDTANSLAIHLQEHGITRETEFLCDFCGKILTTAYQLQYHNRMHLGVKPYSCTICKKTFAKKYNVQLHMTIHTGENKNHDCTHCGKRYSQRCTLLRHLKRYHSDASPKPTDSLQRV